jgi:hypothetical protein
VLVVVLSISPFTLDFFYAGSYWDLKNLVWSHNNKTLIELAVDPRLCEQYHVWGISW